MAKQTTTTPCTRTHQIGALALITITFFTTRLLNQPLSHSPVLGIDRFEGGLRWPERGYGVGLDVKVYVYEEGEIDGIKVLLYGRDGSVKADACLKGQWGTQVKIHRLLLKSRFRTHKKAEADLFFVPSYVNCNYNVPHAKVTKTTPYPPSSPNSHTQNTQYPLTHSHTPMAKQTTTTPCTRTHQIGALALITITFFTTRLLNQPLSHSPVLGSDRFEGGLRWPERGYGVGLDLKVYVYEEDEIDGIKVLLYGRDGSVKADACLKGQWGTQVKIHRLLLKSRFRTHKKAEADLFFVPSYVKCVRMMGGLNDKEINQAYVKVLSQMPYFRLSGGRDHIFVFPSGAGAHLFKSWATYINRSIILTPEGDRTDKRDTSAFNTWKDIIIPGNVDDGMTNNGVRLVEPLPLSKRKYLANYLGRAQGKLGRLQLIDLAKQFPDKLESPELKFSGPEKLGKTDYFLHLRNAKFCLAPRGESSWTLRFYESFFVECVPVLLSDQAELPFQNVVDYSQISIKWPSSRIGTELLEYLESIPDKRIEEMIARGRKMRCLWVYAPDSEPCSALTGILWELQRKTRTFHHSPETFWLHNGSIVNRDLVEFHKWRPPMPLP